MQKRYTTEELINRVKRRAEFRVRKKYPHVDPQVLRFRLAEAEEKAWKKLQIRARRAYESPKNKGKTEIETAYVKALTGWENSKRVKSVLEESLKRKLSER